jgi:hypothetical protein
MPSKAIPVTRYTDISPWEMYLAGIRGYVESSKDGDALLLVPRRVHHRYVRYPNGFRSIVCGSIMGIAAAAGWYWAFGAPLWACFVAVAAIACLAAVLADSDEYGMISALTMLAEFILLGTAMGAVVTFAWITPVMVAVQCVPPILFVRSATRNARRRTYVSGAHALFVDRIVHEDKTISRLHPGVRVRQENCGFIRSLELRGSDCCLTLEDNVVIDMQGNPTRTDPLDEIRKRLRLL